MALIAVSAAIQLASLAFWLPLEIYQMETLGHPTFVVALRFKNIVAFALGKMDAWGLNNYAMAQDPWDYVHITTWNFLPFVLRRVGEAPGWVVKVCLSLWIAGLAALDLDSLAIARGSECKCVQRIARCCNPPCVSLGTVNLKWTRMFLLVSSNA